MKHITRLSLVSCLSALLILFTGCTTIRAIKLVHGGEAVTHNGKTTIPFRLNGHPILIDLHLNNSEKEYSFIVDTGALTIVRKKVAEELKLPEGLQVKARGSAGNTKNITLAQLDSIKVGDMEVTDCAAGVVDLTDFLPPEIDGLLGSNFLRHFTVSFDYIRKEITLEQRTTPLIAQKKDILLPFKTEITLGFAPIIACTVDGQIQTTAEIDTGAFGVALPVNTVKKTDAYQNGNVLLSHGGMEFGINGSEEKTYALYLKTLQLGNLEMYNVPATSHLAGWNHILLGNRFLENFLIILDYPREQVVFRPNGRAPKKETDTYGLSLKKQGKKVVVAGIWEKSSADAAGLSVGDEVIRINGIPANSLPMMSLMSIFIDKKKDTIEIEYINGKGEGQTTLHKQPLPLQRNSNQGQEDNKVTMASDTDTPGNGSNNIP